MPLLAGTQPGRKKLNSEGERSGLCPSAVAGSDVLLMAQDPLCGVMRRIEKTVQLAIAKPVLHADSSPVVRASCETPFWMILAYNPCMLFKEQFRCAPRLL